MFEFQACILNNLLELPESVFEEINNPVCCYSSEKVTNWHDRLGHPSASYLSRLFPHVKESICEVCKMTKSVTATHQSHFKSVKAVLDCLHLDLVGPSPVKSKAGCQCFLTVTDQWSGFCVVQLMKSKEKAPEIIIDPVKEMELQTGRHLGHVVSDGGSESAME